MALSALSDLLNNNGFNATMKNGNVRVHSGWAVLPITIKHDIAKDMLVVAYNQTGQLLVAILFVIQCFMFLGAGAFFSAGLAGSVVFLCAMNVVLTDSSAKEIRQHLRQMSLPQQDI
ncbi:hypothetical protein A1OQ_16150 [Enterovibrio norvegicus FF-162]|uniref:hypothetical protein n=1 Tax=Enterovibrio norvegicus TaxID=188144 RepID=UPI0003013DD2|nr:hypothetical protein [Enterovibrio norvegicus]OEE86977.1 hypothetical protein A1OQ_16150 [Enterovibrio norvegicus FF-162]